MLKPLKGVLFGLPGVIKVDSCTKPQHFRWVSSSPNIVLSWRRVRPQPRIGPVKLTIGGITGKLSTTANVRGAMLRHLLVITLYQKKGIINSRLITLVADDECRNGVILQTIASLKAVARLDLPGECIGMNASVHKEPDIAPLGRNNRLVVD